MPIFPTVPNVPGVPPLVRNPAIAGAVEFPLLVADVVGLFTNFFAPKWGLFSKGSPVVVAESVISVEFKQDWSVSTYPLEKGAFESYDKVTIPFDVRLRFSAGGSESKRQSLLNSIESIAGTLTLFDAYTPEKIYTGVNVTHFDYHRTASNGVGLLVVDVWCVEVREKQRQQFVSNPESVPQFSGAPTGSGSGPGGGAFQAGNTQSAVGADPVGIGNVQAAEPLRITVRPIN